MDEQAFAQQSMNQDAAMIMGRSAYMNQDDRALNTLLNDLTDVDTVLDSMELLLQGVKIDPTNGTPRQVAEPLCNHIGAANSIRQLRSLLTRVVLMSNFEEEQVRVITQEIGFDMVEDLTFNRIRYGIIHPKAISTIINLTLTNGFANAMSAMDNGTRQMLKKAVIETTVNAQGNQMKAGKGGIGSLFGFGKK